MQDNQRYPEISKDIQRNPEIPRDIQRCQRNPEISRDTQRYSEISRDIQRNGKMSREIWEMQKSAENAEKCERLGNVWYNIANAACTIARTKWYQLKSCWIRDTNKQSTVVWFKGRTWSSWLGIIILQLFAKGFWSLLQDISTDCVLKMVLGISWNLSYVFGQEYRGLLDT